MIHPAWLKLLPRLRSLLDTAGLNHVSIRERSKGEALSEEDLLEIYNTVNISFDEYVSFEPADPECRIYRVQGADHDESIGRAHISDFQQTPSISLSSEGQWQMVFIYDQGCLPAETFDSESSFLDTLLDCLVKNFSHRAFILGVCVYPDGCSWGRITE